MYGSFSLMTIRSHACLGRQCIRKLLPMCANGIFALVLGGCIAHGDTTKPIPTTSFAAPQTAHRLVVMLPGRGDDLDALKQHAMAAVIQRHWPDADVVLTGLTMPWYTQGLASKRLHDEVIAPAIAKGEQNIWVLGISLGGMGALLYDHDYPGEISGMLLLSPYLGDDAIRDEIIATGGLAKWNAGPPQVLGPDTFQHELWRSLQHRLTTDAASVWIAYGDAEPFRHAIELATPLLPSGHAIELSGHHDWTLWSAAVPAILDRADVDGLDAKRPRTR